MIGIFAVPMQYLIYENPQLFVLALLALNGIGVLVITEYVTVEHLHRTNFDSPPLRAGKALTSLAVALALVTVFQFVFRNSARKQVRLALAK